MKRLFLGIAVLIAMFGLSQISSASIINGGFETGDMSGWSLVGTYAWNGSGVQNGAPSIGAHEGTYSGRLTASTPTNAYATLSQTLDLMAGDTLDGWHALRNNDTANHNYTYGDLCKTRIFSRVITCG